MITTAADGEGDGGGDDGDGDGSITADEHQVSDWDEDLLNRRQTQSKLFNKAFEISLEGLTCIFEQKPINNTGLPVEMSLELWVEDRHKISKVTNGRTFVVYCI